MWPERPGPVDLVLAEEWKYDALREIAQTVATTSSAVDFFLP